MKLKRFYPFLPQEYWGIILETITLGQGPLKLHGVLTTLPNTVTKILVMLGVR